jgi:hypothetical protein
MTDIIDRLRACSDRMQVFPMLPTRTLRQEAGSLTEDVLSVMRLAASEIRLLREREARRDTLPPEPPAPPMATDISQRHLSPRARLYASGNRRTVPN